MEKRVVGVIGGTGLYQIEGLEKVREVEVDTPFGRPSDAYVTGTLDGTDFVFLPRHGKGHRLLPTELNFRANIFGMKKLGVGEIISVSAVGSLSEEIEPGHVVVPDQFIDRTTQRQSTFFGQGIVAHVGFADPFCPVLRQAGFRAQHLPPPACAQPALSPGPPDRRAEPGDRARHFGHRVHVELHAFQYHTDDS
ncbi:MAG: MTAP family purine nucleoside phosphorylase [Acidobacteria bacterium]|nr:MTAP family purine nucleoside phosphorylase [Acidobacteriota bacterium]